MTLRILVAVLIASTTMAEEPAWKPLFDGKSLEAWESPTGGEPGEGWRVENGCLHRAAKSGDLISKAEYRDFELEFEWRISAAGNSGVKYRVRRSPAGWVGPEYQVLDDAGHPNGKVADTTAASLYEVVPAAKDKVLKPVGEWNVSRILVRGTVLEHWLNGKLTVRIDTAGSEWAALKKDSKFSRLEGFAGPVAGRILIQDHGDEVWFRAIRIREL